MGNLRDYMFGCCTHTTSATLGTLEKLRREGAVIDINNILGRMTFDCFTSIAFGHSFDSMSLYPSKHPFGVAFDRLVELMANRGAGEPFWKLKRLLNVGAEAEIAQHLKVIDEFSADLISQKMQNAKQRMTDETGQKTFDLFTLYSTHNKELSAEQMKFIALNFIIAGRDTTRMMTSWFLYDLSQHSDVKAQVLEEIDAFAAEHGDDLSYQNATKGLPYLEAALCESLRYHPVVPFSFARRRRM